MIKIMLILFFSINCFAFKTGYAFVDNKNIRVKSSLILEKNKQYYVDEMFVKSIINNYYKLKENTNCNNFKDFLNNKTKNCSIENEINNIYNSYLFLQKETNKEYNYFYEKKYFVKINFNKNNNFIDINTVSQGRFTQIIKEETKNNYLFVYTKGQTIIFDKKLNKVLASNPIFFIEGNSILMGIRNSIFVMGGSQSPIFRGAGIIHSGEKEMLKEIFNIEGLI